MQAAQSRGTITASERADAAVGSVRAAVQAPPTARIVLGLLLVAAIVWLIAAPSAPAAIAVIGSLIALAGWGSEAASPADLTLSDF